MRAGIIRILEQEMVPKQGVHSSILGDSTPDSVGPDKVERAIAEMMAKDRSERSNARGTSRGRSKLERLRLK